MATHGGGGRGQGRKSKAEEIKLIEQLTPIAPKALEALKAGIERGEFNFVKLFYDYYAGKPTDKVDVTTNGKDLPTTKEIVFRDYNAKP